MSTTPQQLRLAADILQNGWEWEYAHPNRPTEWQPSFNSLGFMVANMANGTPYLLRRKPLAFPPLPDGCTWHNPDRLTADQVGEGWRLTVGDEAPSESSTVWGEVTRVWRNRDLCANDPYCADCTYRVPLTTPYPDGSKIVDGKLVKPEPAKPIALDLCDIPPGSVLRMGTAESWQSVVFAGSDGVVLSLIHKNEYHSYESLMRREAKILRPGKTEWEPCHKLP